MVRYKRFLLIMMMMLTGCGMKINVMGVDTTWLESRQWEKVVAGAVVSVAVHEAAHWGAVKLYGHQVEWSIEQSGIHQQFNGGSHVSSVQRAGFLTQLGLGLLLNFLPETRGTDFTLGWNTISLAQLSTYPIRNPESGDFDSNRQKEWEIFTGMAGYNSYLTFKEINEKT